MNQIFFFFSYKISQKVNFSLMRVFLRIHFVKVESTDDVGPSVMFLSRDSIFSSKLTPIGRRGYHACN